MSAPTLNNTAFDAWLDSQDFYELCQAYRHAEQRGVLLPGMPTAAQAYENLQAGIRAAIREGSAK